MHSRVWWFRRNYATCICNNLWSSLRLSAGMLRKLSAAAVRCAAEWKWMDGDAVRSIPATPTTTMMISRPRAVSASSKILCFFSFSRSNVNQNLIKMYHITKARSEYTPLLHGDSTGDDHKCFAPLCKNAIILAGRPAGRPTFPILSSGRHSSSFARA